MTAGYTTNDALLHISARAQQAVTNMTTLRDHLQPTVTAAEWPTGR